MEKLSLVKKIDNKDKEIIIGFFICCFAIGMIIWSANLERKERRNIQITLSKQQEEISPEEYKILVNRTIKCGTIKYLVYDMMYDDNKISRAEFNKLDEIYSKIAKMDHLGLFLQEKAYGSISKSSD